MKTYFVEVVRLGSDEVVRRVDCGTSKRKADRVEMGMLRQMDLDEFSTQIVEEEQEQEHEQS